MPDAGDMIKPGSELPGANRSEGISVLSSIDLLTFVSNFFS